MRRIDRVASAYRARGHKCVVLSARCCLVTDKDRGNAYRVTANGRAVVGRELAATVAAELEDPNFVGPE